MCAAQEWRTEDLFTAEDEKRNRKIDKSLTTDWLDFDPRQPHTQKLCQSSCISFVAGPSSAASHFNLTTDWRNNRQFISHRSLSPRALKVSDWLTANHVSVNPATWCVRFVGSREIDAFLSMRTTYSCLCDLFVFSHLSTKLYIFHLFFNSIQSTCLDDSLRLSGKRIWSCDCISWCRT